MMAIHEWEMAAINAWLCGGLNENSIEAQQGRRALGRILRQEPLPMDIGRKLADRFDPERCVIVGRRFALERARGCGRPKQVNDLRVAAIVWEHIKADKQKKVVYPDAGKKAGVSPSAAEKAYAKHKKNLRGLRDWGLESEITKIANEPD